MLGWLIPLILQILVSCLSDMLVEVIESINLCVMKYLNFLLSHQSKHLNRRKFKHTDEQWICSGASSEIFTPNSSFRVCFNCCVVVVHVGSFYNRYSPFSRSLKIINSMGDGSGAQAYIALSYSTNLHTCKYF